MIKSALIWLAVGLCLAVGIEALGVPRPARFGLSVIAGLIATGVAYRQMQASRGRGRWKP